MQGLGKVYIVGLDESVRRMFFDRGYEIILNGGDITKADIVCFIGGWDIDPSLYGQTKNKTAHVSVNPTDDKRDLLAWSKAPEDALKVGICRGGQFLHVMNGGRLFQHVSGHASQHKIYDTVYKKEFIATSSHHQMMRPTLGGEVFAYSEGIGKDYQGEYGDVEPPGYEPEVIWHETNKSLCVQFHPEWKAKDSTEQNYFFDLINMVRS